MLTTLKATKLYGKIKISGDKSISHRALILGAIAQGCTVIKNLSSAKDVQQTIYALQELGVRIENTPSEHKIYGLGLSCFIEPNKILNLGNSGTAARLLIGLLSSYNMKISITGDDSLKARPMERVLQALRFMGGQFSYKKTHNFLPLEIKPNPHPIAINWQMQLASAQVKSAIMLAALNALGRTEIIEYHPTRDHSELLFKTFKAAIEVKQTIEHKVITIIGQQPLKAANITIAGDFSSAAFIIVGALLIKDSDVTLKDIGCNPTRIGLLHCLIEMGASISLNNHRIIDNEKICDIRVKYSQLTAIEVPSARNTTMIDEFPILAIAASLAKGKTIFRDIGELKYKESNRLLAIKRNLNKVGIKCELIANELHIYGTNAKNLIASTVKSYNDHRIAMSFLILSLCSTKNIYIDNISMIDTSFKEFFVKLKILGAKIEHE